MASRPVHMGQACETHTDYVAGGSMGGPVVGERLGPQLS